MSNGNKLKFSQPLKERITIIIIKYTDRSKFPSFIISWPDKNIILQQVLVFRRIQEIDGSYFESFTALAWKQENQRQSVLKSTERAATEPPPQEFEMGITPIDYSMSQNEKDKLYVEMLYTIANTVSGL